MSGAARGRVREWVARYLPLERLGTLGALLGAWLAFGLTDALVVAALAGTIAETVGYYALAVVRGIRAHLAADRVRRVPSRPRRALLATGLELRSLAAEFGPAEVLDTVLVRPALRFAVPAAWGGHPAAWLVGKLLADVVFYVVAIVSFELGRRVILPAPSDAAPAPAAAPAPTPAPAAAPTHRSPILEAALR